MPASIRGQGQSPSFKRNSIPWEDHDYSYPGGLDLRPGSELHESIRLRILDRCRDSWMSTSRRFDSWRQIDQVLTAYIPSDEEEDMIKQKDSRKPVSIIFPYSYAVMEVVLTYLVAALMESPLFRYEGVSPEDTIGAVLLEKVIAYQCYKTKMSLAIHTLLRDSATAYGVGYVVPGWEKKLGSRIVRAEDITVSPLGTSVRPYKKTIEEEVIFEGVKLDNVSPYVAFPDPNVPAHKVQDGEFFGWLRSTNYQTVLQEELLSDGDIFNAKYLKGNNGISQFGGEQSDREVKYGYAKPDGQSSTQRIDVIYMYATIIPKDWELSPSERPEKWLFALGSDNVILQAKKTNFIHGQYPVACAAPDFDGYSTLPMSRLEILYGLQEVLSFLFNSHVKNVRKAVNDMFVVDPYRVNVPDIADPEAGKIIRMRRPAWGTGVKDAIMQLPVNDVTARNIGDAQFIMSFMQYASGTDQSMGGMLRQGGPERLSSAEFKGTRAGSIGRMERVARLIGLQAMQDIGFQCAANCQQLMEQDTYVKIIGQWPEGLMKDYQVSQGKVKISPYDILVNYDVIVRDGTVPGSNFDAQTWTQLFQTIMTSQELNQGFDSVRIFKYIARNMGAKNVDDFERKQPRQVTAQTMPDEEVARQAAAGNLIPFGGGQ